MYFFYIYYLEWNNWINKIKDYNIIGWYHSHPGYGCWLSNIDIDNIKIL